MHGFLAVVQQGRLRPASRYCSCSVPKQSVTPDCHSSRCDVTILLIYSCTTMSRIPQPSRRPSKTSMTPAPTTPTRPRVLNSIASTPSARTTVRKTGSAVSLKAKTPTTPRLSPAKAKPPTSTNVNSRAVSEKNPSTSSMSVREAIARKRAEVKKAQARSGESDGFDTMSSLQDALPPHVNPAQQEEDVLGRATLKETIDKARSTGDDMFLFPCNS